MSKWWALALAVTAAGCTRHNEKFCCLSSEDCAAAGVDSEGLECAAGLSCVEHVCQVPTCSSGGCTSTAPVCDIRTDVCGGCNDSSDCTRFAPRAVCEPTSGSCVECLASTDCATDTPVCDNGACRGCRVDAECPSSACNDDGTCVPETGAIYLSPNGTDSPPCSKTAPCRELAFAASQATASRMHIVFAPGTYLESLIVLTTATTTASSLVVHGGGAVLVGSSGDGLLTMSVPGTLRDLELVNTKSTAATFSSTLLAERVKFSSQSLGGASFTVIANGDVNLRDVQIIGDGSGIQLQGGTLTIERATITGNPNSVTTGISASGSGVVNITNLLVSETNGLGLDLPGVTGSIQFSTIAATGSGTTGPTAIACNQSSLTITRSIIWTPNLLNSRPTVQGGCPVTGSIVGPVPLAGNVNADPLFVGPLSHNFHISGGSPARDVAPTGPATDFEGDRRPVTLLFDLGADEVP